MGRGSQVNLLMTPQDTDAFEARLRKLDPEIAFVGYRLKKPEPDLLASLRVEKMGEAWLKTFLVPRDRLSDLRYSHVPAQGYWAVDELRSPTVELRRCYFTGKLLRPGRLFFKSGYFDARREWCEKPAVFVSWAGKILSLARRFCTRSPNGFYAGPDAAKWIDGGGQIDMF